MIDFFKYNKITAEIKETELLLGQSKERMEYDIKVKIEGLEKDLEEERRKIVGSIIKMMDWIEKDERLKKEFRKLVEGVSESPKNIV